MIEFRKPDGSLVDVGTVTTSANMPMPGMTMPGSVQVDRSDVPGRYSATGDFGMAGGWQMKIEWNGPAGQGDGELRGNRAMTRMVRSRRGARRQPRCASTRSGDRLAGEDLTLAQAIALPCRASPRCALASADVEMSRGMSAQADLRANPTVSFEHRQEPGGTDTATDVGIEWPLETVATWPAGRRRGGRRERGGTRGSGSAPAARADVAAAYGEAAAAARELAITDEVLAAISKQLELLRARAAQGATPTLDRDMVDVEVRRIQAERSVQAGRVDRALLRLKRLLGMSPEAPLRVTQSLEELVADGAAGA